MKTQSLSEIAIEAVITISLIALLGLLTALVYALLAFLGHETKIQSLLTSQEQTDEIVATLPSAKAAPKLEPVIAERDTEILANFPIKPLTKMTVQELRPLAKDRKIPNWRKLKKKELLLYLTA
jgi:hypothetical protein